MLKKHSQIFVTLLFVADILVISFSWVISYYLRFYIGIIPVYKEIPSFSFYLQLLLPVIIIWGIIFKASGLYAPMRISSHINEVFKIFRASSLAILIFIALTYFASEYKFSRVVFFYFWIINVLGFSLSRTVLRKILKYFRRKGYNLRFVLIVGAGKLGRQVAEGIIRHPQLGLRVKGFLTRNTKKIGELIDGIPVLGFYEDVQKVAGEQGIDQVFIALPLEEHLRLKTVLENIEDVMVDVKIVPDLYQFVTLRGGIEELGKLPVISLRDSPMYGWNRIIKRTGDLVFALASIVLTLPLTIPISLIIKLTSPGPVFYKQERMGIDGKIFNMFKFRSMAVDAEKDTGAVWATENDSRRTKFGALLRKLSLDELPQLINVLNGEMSIVGPRPERPVFIKNFRKSIPQYMLRHTMKTGITGWAQVNGWRGNTSLEKRIKFDLLYIENWSLAFDLKIIWLTLWKGLINKNAY